MTASAFDQPHRLFFVRIMKTAGGSPRRRLIHHVGEGAVYPTKRLDGTDPLLQEHVEDVCDELEARFGWNLGEPVWANVTAPAEVPKGLRGRIAEDNALDIELYVAEWLLATDASRRSPPAVGVGA
jgi:hypothetical protein